MGAYRMADERVSFVPKKAQVGAGQRQPKSIGIGFLVAAGLLILSVVVGGGGFLYKRSVAGNVETLEASLARAEEAFDPGLIEELVRTSKKIEAAKVLLSKHRTIVPIFNFLEEATLKNVRFTNFLYSIGADGTPKISMKGVARSYATLSLQGNEFERNKDIRSVKFSGLRLGEGGTVLFAVDLEVNPAMLAYTAPE